jgi:hypothetical protein
MRNILVLALGFCLAGCAIQRAQVAQDARGAMVGLSKEQVLTCMGPPVNKATEGQTEVWTYDSGNGYSASNGSTQFGRGLAGGLMANSSSVSTQRFCRINIVMSGGAVSVVNYSGPTGGLLTGGEQCAYAVESCTKK